MEFKILMEIFRQINWKTKFSNYESKTQIIGNIFMCRSI